MEIRKLDPSNPADAELINNMGDGLYHGEDDTDFDDDDECEEFDDGIEYDLDDDMNDPEHRLDYINKLNEQ